MSEAAWARRGSHTASTVLREYYKNHDFFSSAEWILKVLAVMSCLCWCAVWLSGDGDGGCDGVAWLPRGAAGLALAGAGAGALSCAAAAARLPVHAPRTWLFADIILSTVMGILFLVMSILSIVFCDMNNAANYLRAPLGVLSSALAAGGGVLTHRAATRRLDAARPAREPATPLPTEQEA